MGRVISICLVVLLSPLAAWGGDGLIRTTFVGVEREDTYLRGIEEGGLFFVSTEDLAELLKAETYFNAASKKIVLRLGDRRIKITAFNPFLMLDEAVIQLPVETKFAGGEIYVSLKHFLEAVEEILPFQSSFDEKEKILKIILKDFNITEIDIQEKVNGTLVKISTTKRFDPSWISKRVSRGWLYIDIYQGKIDTTRIGSDQRVGIIEKVLPVQFKQSAQFCFKLAGKVNNKDVYISQEEGAILVSLKTREEIPEDIIQKLESEKKKWLIDKIIIDPGHGGRDPGAIGPTGLYEKTVVLDIAKRLSRLLKRRLGVEVLLTREGDQFVPLKERTSFANREGGKLFISIHANANRDHRLSGCTTYFLGPAKTEEALEVAKRENAVIRYEDSPNEYGDISDESYILLAMAQNSFTKESQDLAAMVQEEFERSLGIKNRGVSQAGYYVLIGASMPNILVETAYISNPREERLLKSRKFREKIAQALFRSIKRFKEKYESGIEFYAR